MALSATLKLQIAAVLTGTLDLASQRASQDVVYPVSYSDGAGAGQANVIWSDRRTLAESASEDIDLSGALTGLLGESIAFARVKAIIVKAAAGNTNNVVVSRPSSSGVPLVEAEELIFPEIRPGGVAMWMDPGATGVAVTNSSADKITVANSSSGSSVEYEITIIGAAS